MEQTTTILDGYSNLEKGAYLGAIASLATADRVASPEEKDYIDALCQSANLTDDQKKLIAHVATMQVADEDLNRFLDVLKTSDLRYSLVSDLIAFANADKNYSEEEKKSVAKISQYLGLNDQQFSVLDEFTKKAVQEAPNHAESIQSEKTTPQGFLDSLGFGDKLKSAGINSSSLLKGALGIIGPFVLARMLSGGRSRRGSMGGMFGGNTGGGLMGGGGLLGGLFGGGGLLGGLLGGGRGFGNAGGLLSRILGGRRW
ncbi:MAG: TerB family tellurite resistance protein [Bacteroidota bacterium]|nr:TerB family tellurite resistance protein [Bacteroidota bacterium]